MTASPTTRVHVCLNSWIQLLLAVLLAGCLLGEPARAGQDQWRQQSNESSAGQPAKKPPSPATPVGQPFCTGAISEKALLKNLLCDQKVIFGTPLRPGTYRTRSFYLFAGATALLIAADQSLAREITAAPPGAAFHAGNDLSHFGSMAGTVGFAGALYGVARLTHRERLRETALLSIEALTDAGILAGLLKTATQRQRPTEDTGLQRLNDARGEFWAGGRSFPSGHAMGTWALASVFASRYKDKPAVKYSAYGLAAVISASRLAARRHFASEVVVGGFFGYFIGRYVARSR